MKKLGATISVFTLLILFAIPTITFAQAPDTVMVSAFPVGNINTFIMADTNATGGRANPNRVYELYRDSIYYFTGVIKQHFNLSIIAASGKGALPVLEPAILANNSRPSTFIETFSGNLKLKQLYLSDFAPDGIPSASAKAVISVSDSSKFKIDSCIFDGWRAAAIWEQGKNNSYWITDNIFRNLQDYLGWYGADSWFVDGSIPIDTVYFVNNTVFCSGGYTFYARISKYTVFSHNTIFLNDINPLGMFNTTNGVFDNNIFYGVDAGAYTAPTGGGVSIIWLHTLLYNVGTLFNITEPERRVEVKNNAYYWPQTQQNFWKTYDDTTSNHQLYPPVFMDGPTQAMFNDTTFYNVQSTFINDTLVATDTTSEIYAADTSFIADTTVMGDTTIIVNKIKSTKWYPYFVASGNVNADPGFSPSILGQVDSLQEYVRLHFSNGLKTYIWWYNPTNGPLAPPTQPVPENLAYTNTALQHAGTDGFALGDLNWFPQQHEEWLAQQTTDVKTVKSTIPTGYSLKQNYPNPFNPSTVISYSIPKESHVVLKIFNVLGQEVSTLVNTNQIAGSYKVDFNASSLASGVYFYSLKSGNFAQVKKMVLLK